MEKNEKVFLSTQLLAVLPPNVLKVAAYLVNWQNSPNGIMLYEHRFAKTLKMSDLEIRLCIQTLINLKLIDLTNIDGKFRIEFNPSEWQKYYKIPMDRVIEHEGYKLATKATYDEAEQEEPKKEMTTEQMRKMIQMLQVKLQEKEEVEKMVVSASSKEDDLLSQLPF